MELPWGKLKRCMDSPEYADRLFVPFVLLFIQVQGLPSLGFFDTGVRIQVSLPFCLPYLLQISVNLSREFDSVKNFVSEHILLFSPPFSYLVFLIWRVPLAPERSLVRFSLHTARFALQDKVQELLESLGFQKTSTTLLLLFISLRQRSESSGADVLLQDGGVLKVSSEMGQIPLSGRNCLRVEMFPVRLEGFKVFLELFKRRCCVHLLQILKNRSLIPFPHLAQDVASFVHWITLELGFRIHLLHRFSQVRSVHPPPRVRVQ